LPRLCCVASALKATASQSIICFSSHKDPTPIF
jgi:hypothetical protein